MIYGVTILFQLSIILRALHKLHNLIIFKKQPYKIPSLIIHLYYYK